MSSKGGKKINYLSTYQVVIFEDLLHLLNGLEIAKHVPTKFEKINIVSTSCMASLMVDKLTDPTEQTEVDSLIALATVRARSTEPVATGFSMNIATPGKYLSSFNSMSAPGRSEPLN